MSKSERPSEEMKPILWWGTDEQIICQEKASSDVAQMQ